MNLKKYSVHKGFTLIELVLTIGIGVIILSVAGSLLNITLKTTEVSNNMDNVFNDAYFALNYMSNEILNSDYIIKNTNDNSLGFALVTKDGGIYNYCYYSFEGSNIYRNAVNYNFLNLAEKMSSYIPKGKNSILSNVTFLNCNMNDDLIEINLKISQNNQERVYKKILAIRKF